jgi:hypothetical protein
MNLTVIGLVLDIFGAWLLAYEIIWGYQRKDKAIYAEIRLKNIEKNYEISKRMMSDDKRKIGILVWRKLLMKTKR